MEILNLRRGDYPYGAMRNVPQGSSTPAHLPSQRHLHRADLVIADGKALLAPIVRAGRCDHLFVPREVLLAKENHCNEMDIDRMNSAPPIFIHLFCHKT